MISKKEATKESDLGTNLNPDRENEISVRVTARLSGAIYFLFMIVAIVGEFLLPTFMVPGDATSTAQNIISSESSYRFGILLSFITLVIFILLVMILFKLLKTVDKSHAILMVLLVVVGVSVALANLLNKLAPLVLLSGADYLTVFSKSQLDALSLAFLRLHSSGSNITSAFWGLWLFPFGYLVIKSGFLPRILGFLLIVAGFGYLTISFVSLALPEYRKVVSQVMMPLYFGEVPIIFWLLIKGVKIPHLSSDTNSDTNSKI